MTKIGVLGAGTWGMALARMLSNAGCEVMVWSALPQEIDALQSTRVHPNLPEMEIPSGMGFTKELAEVCVGKDVVVFAVPSVFVRQTARAASDYLSDGQIIVDVAKGIEPGTLFTMSQIIEEETGGRVPIVALSGPTHAEEVARDLPTTIVAASRDLAAAERIQDLFMTPTFRVYTNDDVLGVELCGAMKNVIALSAGICTGLGYGDNAKAALMTRGMAEIMRLGTAMGAKEHTFAGLAGIGDLIVTATSMHSRNNRCGQMIGQGIPVDEATKRVGMVVEGLNALPAAMELKEKYGVEMPITEAIETIVSGGADPRDTVDMLMLREKKAE